MEAAELRNGDNLSNIQHLSGKRTLLAQAQVRSRFMVVAEIGRKRSFEMAGVQDDVVVGSGRHGCKSGKVKVLPPSIAWQTASIPDARIGNDA